MYKGAADQEWEKIIAFVSNDGSLNYIEENISNSFYGSVYADARTLWFHRHNQ